MLILLYYRCKKPNNFMYARDSISVKFEVYRCRSNKMNVLNNKSINDSFFYRKMYCGGNRSDQL